MSPSVGDWVVSTGGTLGRVTRLYETERGEAMVVVTRSVPGGEIITPISAASVYTLKGKTESERVEESLRWLGCVFLDSQI